MLQWAGGQYLHFLTCISRQPPASIKALYFQSIWCLLGKIREKREKQNSICTWVISQNSLLFMQKISLRDGSHAPRTEDWFIFNVTGVHWAVQGNVLSWYSYKAKQLCSWPHTNCVLLSFMFQPLPSAQSCSFMPELWLTVKYACSACKEKVWPWWHWYRNA